MAIFHSVRFCAKSLSMTWYPVFRDLLLLLLPLNNYISTFLHHAIITASLYMAIPPQSASSNEVPNAIKAQTLPKFWRRLLFFKVTLPFHIIILISLRSNLNKSASFTDYRISKHDTSNTCLVHLTFQVKGETPTSQDR